MSEVYQKFSKGWGIEFQGRAKISYFQTWSELFKQCEGQLTFFRKGLSFFGGWEAVVES